MSLGKHLGNMHLRRDLILTTFTMILKNKCILQEQRQISSEHARKMKCKFVLVCDFKLRANRMVSASTFQVKTFLEEDKCGWQDRNFKVSSDCG